jgi:hypothetical protein
MTIRADSSRGPALVVVSQRIVILSMSWRLRMASAGYTRSPARLLLERGGPPITPPFARTYPDTVITLRLAKQILATTITGSH